MDRRRRPIRVRGTTPEIDEAAKQHRVALTPAEATLWQALKGRAVDGLKFRRQHPLGRFILDFCCPALKLAIETTVGSTTAKLNTTRPEPNTSNNTATA